MVMAVMAVAALIKMVTTIVRVSFCKHFFTSFLVHLLLMLILVRKASHARIHTIIPEYCKCVDSTGIKYHFESQLRDENTIRVA
jgi:hypothetical protein